MIMNPEQAQEDFLTFFEDLYMEFSKFGKLDALHVCDNLGDHMIGTYLSVCIYQTSGSKCNWKDLRLTYPRFMLFIRLISIVIFRARVHQIYG